MGWFDKLLSIGATADWITPAVSIMNEIGHDHTSFYFDRHCGFSLNQIEKILTDRNIRILGDAILDDDTMYLSVEKCHAKMARYLLLKVRVPFADTGD